MIRAKRMALSVQHKELMMRRFKFEELETWKMALRFSTGALRFAPCAVHCASFQEGLCLKTI